jgi:hypothetical protein
VRIQAALTPGSKLIFGWQDLKNADQPRVRTEVTISITDVAPLPASLGELDVSTMLGLTVAGSSGGECQRQLQASYADVDLRLSPEATPYADALRYELRVDGDQPWQFKDTIVAPSEPRLGSSSLGPKKDRVIVSCESDPYLAPGLSAYRSAPTLEPGSHRVRMVGVLPDTTEISSAEVVIDLSCGADAGAAASGHDAGATATDAATRDASAKSDRAAASGGGGCTVVAPCQMPRHVEVAFLAMLASLHAARRRKRARTRDAAVP